MKSVSKINLYLKYDLFEAHFIFFIHFYSNFQINNLENILYNVIVKTPLMFCEIYANISMSMLIVISIRSYDTSFYV